MSYRRPSVDCGASGNWICSLLLIPFVIACLLDVPRELRFGSISLLGVLTVFQVVAASAGLIAVAAYPTALVRQFAPYGLFLGWMLLRSSFDFPTLAGLQNGLV